MLLATLLNGQTMFGPQRVIVYNEADGATSVHAADLDGDGYLDILASSVLNNKIAWYKNLGAGNFGTQQIITTANGVRSVYAADLDGDGDIDVLAASFNDSKIAWYANDGYGNFGAQQIISFAANGPRSVYAADLDGDGDIDVLSASELDNKIAWYPNNGTGIFGIQQIISTAAYGAKAVYAADLDGDGDIDVLSASANDNKIAYYKNNGTGNFGIQLFISNNAIGASAVYVADLNGDGHVDVLSAAEDNNTIAWYANTTTGFFGLEQIISTTANGARSVFAADLDGDGDIDVLSALYDANKIVWYENNGTGNFGDEQIITATANGANAVYAADLNNNGSIDVLWTSYLVSEIAWSENDGIGNFNLQPIISANAMNPTSVFAADIDGDGDIDVLSASFTDNKIAWYENDGVGNFIDQHVITSFATNAYSVYAADLDGDGDIDVLSAGANLIAWYQNDGTGNFGAQLIISTAVNLARSVYAADINGDGYIDVLSASASDDKIAWYPNDGLGNFGLQQIISTEADGAKCVYAADLDGDGDVDVLSAYHSNYSRIAWYENDGLGNFGPQQIISNAVPGANSVYAADLDKDGAIDVLSASSNNSAFNYIAWYKNDGLGNFGPQQIISSNVLGARAVYAADLDSDGDIDVLSAAYSPTLNADIAWYQNDGAGNFGSQQIISTSPCNAYSVYAADLDGDGDLDVITAPIAENKVVWYENLLAFSLYITINNPPCIGASNGSVLVNALGSVFLLPPYSYSWTSDNGTSGSGTTTNEVFTLDNLSTGTYNITVTNNAGAVAEAAIALNTVLGNVFEITDITTTNTSIGLPNGVIQLTLEGGETPYIISWAGVSSGSFSNNNQVFTISNLYAGSYNIQITDAEGNVLTKTVLLLDETTPQNTCLTPMDIVILNDVSGSVDVIEYEEAKLFFTNIINSLNIGTTDTQSRVAIVEWSGNGEQQVQIAMTGSLPSLQNYTSFTRAFSGGTNPNEALNFGYNYLQNLARPFAAKVLILSTDGAPGQVSNSLVALAETYKAQGYIIVSIAFDEAYTHTPTHNILTQTASIPLLAPGAPAYSQLSPNLANNIVNLYICPADPGSSNTYYFYRDGIIDITDYTINGFCPNPTGVTIHYTITAQQQLSLPAGTPITFYYNNPALFGAMPILTTFIPCAIPAGSSETFSTYLPITSPAQVFAVLNDNGSQTPPFILPTTNIPEHVYSNNIDNIAICTNPLPTLAATLLANTPTPVCGNTALFTLSVCNIGPADAQSVSIAPQMPAGFVLLHQNANLNGCAQAAGVANTYHIPAGCCVTLTLQYNVSGAAIGFYPHQQVALSGPSGQEYIHFNGINTSVDDLTITGIPDCPSDLLTFKKSTNLTQTCHDSFVTYAFTIHNQTNLPLQNLTFYDPLPAPAIWAAEPYLPNGLSIGQTNITGLSIAQFTIAQVPPNTVATFFLDAYLGDWPQNDNLPNTATLSGLPAFVNGNGNPLNAYAQTVSVIIPPDIVIHTPNAVTHCQSANLSASLANAYNPQWLSTGDGFFTHPNSLQTTYIPGVQDLLNGTADIYLNAQNQCGDGDALVQLHFAQAPLCNDNDCNTDDILNPDTCQCEYLTITPPNCDDNNPLTTDVYNPDDCQCQHPPTGYVLLPNAFSPNADGENDLFKAVYNFPISQFYIAVYNRWGQRVFETSDIEQGWNGMLNQSPLPMGVYTWYAIYRFQTHTHDNHISGNVTLIR